MARSARGIRQAQPLYMLVAERLATGIAAGKHPVGTLLPTEVELCRQFSVSRFTVRESVKQLQSLGLVATRRGIGTEVLAKRPTGGRFIFLFDSVNDFRHSAHQTRLIDISSEEVPADRAMAVVMRCPVGHPLLRIGATRVLARPKGRIGKPVALAEVLLLAVYAEILAELPNHHLTISDLLEHRYGVRTSRIEQIVEPCAVTSDEARKLGVQTGSLGLRFKRTYLDPRGEVFEYAVSLQAGDEARMSMTIRANDVR